MTRVSENLIAVLGPTNTGKTHLAIERMLAHESGMIGLPLRLLAREVYNKVAERVSADQVALITGEEKIKPPSPRYYVCTVEAMPRDVAVAFLAVDEVQLAADFDRGHVFTDRMLRQRGTQETLLLGAATIRPLVESLLPHANILSRPRLSELRYAGQTKITRLPRRAAIVAFSAAEVYAIAELVRRQRGGAAVVMGALSPRTRNAQVGLYQAGEVDYLIATDAIGMGLNLDIDHVAFAAERKFDGHQFRNLTPAEIGQIAGRAGRHMRNGTFGVTGRVDPFEQTLVERIESHAFETLKVLQWRNSDLDTSTIDRLKASLAVAPTRPGLTRAPVADDETGFDIACRDEAVRDMAATRDDVARLWGVCQVPDYRKIAPANHADLIVSIFRHLQRDGAIPDDWFAQQLAYADRTDGDIDTLSNRIAHVRTWTFVANRPDWLKEPAHWQAQTRAIEDKLSDALHECLAQRFVDRRTSVLMRRLRENDDLDVEIVAGDVRVEGQHVGQLKGFHFAPDQAAGGNTHGKALRAAALRGLAAEYTRRAEELVNTADGDILLTDAGQITWRGETVARIVLSDDALLPRVVLVADEQLQPLERGRIQERLDQWLGGLFRRVLEPLFALREAENLTGIARGIAFRLVENYGALDRRQVTDDLRNLDQDARRLMRQLGVRFAAHSVFVPALLKPAAARLTRLTWALRHGGLKEDMLAHLPQLAAQGLMSVPLNPDVPKSYYAATGYRICGPRAVRIDMLERLADLIRPLVIWKPEKEDDTPPQGALGQGRFAIMPQMMSLVGCSGEDFAEILKTIGFRRDKMDPPAAAPEPVSADPQQPETAVPGADAAGEPAQTALSQQTVPPVAPAPDVWRVRGPKPNRHRPRVAAGAGANDQTGGKVDGKADRPRPDKRHHRPKRKDRPAGETPPAVARAAKPAAKAPPRRPKEPDPLSPFAALAGLKRELQAKDKQRKRN